MKLKTKIKNLSMELLFEDKGKTVDISFLLPRGFKLVLLEKALAQYFNLHASDDVETFIRNLFRSLYGENPPESIRRSEENLISYLKWALEQKSGSDSEEVEQKTERTEENKVGDVQKIEESSTSSQSVSRSFPEGKTAENSESGEKVRKEELDAEDILPMDIMKLALNRKKE